MALVVLCGSLLGATPVNASPSRTVRDTAPTPDASSLAAPVLLTPPGATADTEPLLRWAPISGASTYLVQVSASDDFASPVYVSTTANTAATPELDLSPGTYRWRVAAKSGAVTSPFASSSFVKTASLGSPTQLGPADGVTLHLPAEAPVISWTPVPGASGYEIEFSRSPDLSDPFPGISPTTSMALEFVEPGIRYYWRVRAMARNGVTVGGWSPVRSLEVDFEIVPTGLTPESGHAAPDMVVGWDPLPGADQYDVQMTPGPTPDWDAAATRLERVTSTQFVIDDPAVEGQGTWAWRVRARGADGRIGSWTAARLISRSLVAGPVLTAPATGSSVGDVATLSWLPVIGASDYQVDVSADPSFASGVSTHTTTETTFDVTTREEVAPFVLVKGTTYFWRVRGLDRWLYVGTDRRPASTWSASRTFVYDPAVSQLLSPASGADVAVPVLTWQTVNARFHRVTIKDKDGVIVDQAMTWANSYTPATRLDLDGSPFTWYLERVALPGTPESTVSWATASRTFNLVTFTATATSPDPTLPIGSHSMITPSITWQPVVGADHYDIYLGSAMPDLEARAWNAAKLHYPAFTDPTGLREAHAHSYRVRAYDASGAELAVGAAGSFVLDPPPAPAIVSPADCLEAGCPVFAETPRLKWDLVPGATVYDTKLDFYPSDRVAPPTTTLGEVSPIGDPWNNSFGGPVTWSVRACVESRCGPFASARYLKESPPVEPLLPADGAVLTGPQVFFTWKDLVTSATPAGRVGAPTTGSWFDHLRVWMPDGAYSIYSEATTGAAILHPGEFTWEVAGYAGSGAASPTIRRSFRVEVPGPALTTPAPGAITGQVPNLAWAPTAFTSAYDVQVYRGEGPDHANLVSSRTMLDPSFTPLQELDAGVYSWRVRSRQIVGFSDWSPLRTFTIDGGSAPVLAAQADPPDLDGVVLFDWTSPTPAAAYRIETSASSSFTQLRESVVLGQTAWAPTAAYPTGTWFWRVKALGPSGAVVATSEVGTVVIDTAGPVGAVAISGGAPHTSTRSVVVQTSATDPAGVAQVALSNDGVSWTVRPYASAQAWTLAAGDGTRRVSVKWKDGLGHWSAVKSDTIALDTVVPSATSPATTLHSGSTVSTGGLPVRVTWSGADATSGVARYELGQSADGGSWTTVSTTLTSPSLFRFVPSGHTIRFRVRAVDKAGNVSAWAYGSMLRLGAVQQSAAAVRYAGSWATSTSTAWWGGTARSSSRAGSTASYTFTGRSIAWVGLKGVGRGKANVYVNDVLKATVDLYSATTKKQVVLWSANYSASATRTITINVLGTAGRPRVDVDGFIVGS